MSSPTQPKTDRDRAVMALVVVLLVLQVLGCMVRSWPFSVAIGSADMLGGIALLWLVFSSRK